MTHVKTQTTPPLVRPARFAYLLLAAGYALGVALQVFFAGASVLVDPNYLELHRTFGEAIGVVTFAMLLVGFVARLPWQTLLWTVLLIALYTAQFLFLWYTARFGLLPLRALHAVNALAMFWLALHLSESVWRRLRSEASKPRPE